MMGFIEYIIENPDIIVECIGVVASWGGALVAGVFGYRAKKKEEKIQIELTKVEALNEQLTYIRNSCFDYEFDVYKELSRKTFLLTSALNTYFFHGFREIHDTDPKKKKNAEDLLKNVIQSYYEYRDALFMSGPFMPEEQFDEFEKFMKLCFSQYQLFYNAKYYDDRNRLMGEEEKANENDAKITKSQTELIKSLRLHIFNYKNLLQKSQQ